MKTDNKNPENNSDQDPGSETIRVTLADDDKDDQQLFEEALDHTSVKTELSIADNGQELMDQLHDETTPNPDVIFLDINMPVKNGKECLDEIKKDEDLKDIPVIVYSTSESVKDVNESFQSGASLYVAKPTSFSKMVSILKHIFTFRWYRLFSKPERKDFVISENTFK